MPQKYTYILQYIFQYSVINMYQCGFLLYFILQIGFLPESAAVTGKEFPVDDHIGTSHLFSEGSFYDRGSSEYTIDLLPAEASSKEHIILRGYYMGFQWYGHESLIEDTRVNIQLYKEDVLTNPKSWIEPFSEDNYDGTYILAYESGWINSKPGLNVFYFNESVTIKRSALRNDLNYVIGIMSDRFTPNPIVKRDCADREQIIVLAGTSSRPYIGQAVQFRYSGSGCTTFSIQGLYLSSEFADDKYNCTMYIASLDQPVEVKSKLGADTNQNECFVVRASTEDYGLSITTDYYTVYDCYSYYVDIGDYTAYFSYDSTGDYNQWDSYCSEVFDEKSTNRPYIQIQSYLATYMQYKFTVVAKEPVNVGLIIGIVVAVFFLLMLIAFIVTVVVCLKCFNRKGTVNQPRQQNSNTTENFSLVNDTSTAPYPVQPMPATAPTQYQMQQPKDLAPPPSYHDVTSS